MTADAARMDDLVFAGLIVAVVAAILVFCVAVGSRRWKQVQANNERVMRISEEAIADRKRILAVLEEIRTLLRDGRR
jgi:hypothetical protein